MKESATSPERANIGADSLYVTPTDDEREALIALRLASYLKTMSDGYSSGVVRTNEEAADLVLTAGFRRTVQGDAGVEYRARATTGHVYGDVRITPEFAVAAYEEALDRETFEQDDETPVVETRRVGPWLPVEQED